MKKLILGLALAFAANAAFATPQPIGESTTTWVLTDGVLTIGGIGAMPDFKGVFPPWFGDEKSITTVIIESGVTSIGDDAFSNCTSLESVSAPSVTSIGMNALNGCRSLKSVYAPSVTSIGMDAFNGCHSLKSVYAPSVTSIEKRAFSGCDSLTSLTVNSAMKADWDSNKDDYGLGGLGPDFKVTFLTTPTLKWDQVAQAEWKTTVTVSTAVKSGDTTLDKDEYENACKYYGITPKTEPTVEDYKVVSKDAQVVKEGEIAVTKESLQAAKAEIVNVANGMVYLGVSVLSNSDITASTAWAPVKFPEDPLVYITEDGTKLIFPIPASAKQGFMILQSGDAKVSEGGVRVPVTSKPWYTPTVED